MRITSLHIKNFKAIREMHIEDIENALILVGQNNTGKTTVLDAIRAAGGGYTPISGDFREDSANIEISMTLTYTDSDLTQMQKNGVVSQYKREAAWNADFRKKLPSFDGTRLSFTFIANKEGWVRYYDGVQKNNPHIPAVFPKIYFMDAERNLSQLQGDLLMLQEDDLLKRMREDTCMFNQAKKCSHCFSCIGLINRKRPKELDAFEAARLLDYKLYQLGLDAFAKSVNENFRKNGGQDEILYSMNRDTERMLTVTTEIRNSANSTRPIGRMGKGMRSIYMLSLLEAHVQDEDRIPSILMVEDPEIFLHPKLQKTTGEILYRLSRRNQVIFSTHSPNLLANFSSRQIRQVVQDGEGCPAIREKTDISAILDDLGYTASDLMNVNFVFIVEGKQDKSRLPLLIRRYYSETYDADGKLSRIAIITTNSCTNIKTYANLKYMNQIYLRDQFLMIRDGDGRDAAELGEQLCRYYEERNLEDADKLPKVRPENVLILKYYSFENYFLNPAVMTKLGIVESEDAFYETLFAKWREYLYRIKSGRQLRELLGRDFTDAADLRRHMEEIRIHVRGHNLYDIFYGRYRDEEEALLQRYIEIAPREEFADILDAIDRFIYFESRKRKG